MRTLRELQRCDRKEAASVDPFDDGPRPDIEAMRARLADRLERMRRDAEARPAAEGLTKRRPDTFAAAGNAPRGTAELPGGRSGCLRA